MVSKVIEYPFDTVKVRQQVDPTLGPLRALSDTWREGGLRRVYKGLLAPMIGAMAENAIVFGIYSKSKRWLAGSESTPAQSPLWHTAAAGFVAGVGVAFWLTPVEFVKVRLQSPETSHLYRNSVDCLLQSIRGGGLLSLFRGHSFTVMRESVGGAVYFGAYEEICKLVTPPGKKKADLPLPVLMGAGALAGIGYWTMTFPFDTVKSQVQSSRGLQRGFFRALSDAYRAIGFRGLYRGYSVTVLRAVPANAVIFSTYELTVHALQGF